VVFEVRGLGDVVHPVRQLLITAYVLQFASLHQIVGDGVEVDRMAFAPHIHHHFVHDPVFGAVEVLRLEEPHGPADAVRLVQNLTHHEVFDGLGIEVVVGHVLIFPS
jgi:hypothetical protein